MMGCLREVVRGRESVRFQQHSLAAVVWDIFQLGIHRMEHEAVSWPPGGAPDKTRSGKNNCSPSRVKGVAKIVLYFTLFFFYLEGWLCGLSTKLETIRLPGTRDSQS